MKTYLCAPLTSIVANLNAFDDVIDTRSPSEFAIDHLPGAINCPVLTDVQRVEVGTLHKQESAFEAKKIGAIYVAQNIAQHIDASFKQKTKDWKPLIYCWRGGNRSAAFAHVLSKIGWSVTQLEGGYKAYRQHVVTALDTLPMQRRFIVICGPTGSGKSKLLDALASQGAQVLDLEFLARHKGSILGSYAKEPQPSQKAFESGIWKSLIDTDPSQPIFVESESKKIGNLHVPNQLMQVIRDSACIKLDMVFEERVKHLINDYPHFVADADRLINTLAKLIPLHGAERVGQWIALVKQHALPELVSQLLQVHYDPAYTKSIARNFPRFEQAGLVSIDRCDDVCLGVAAGRVLYAVCTNVFAK